MAVAGGGGGGGDGGGGVVVGRGRLLPLPPRFVSFRERDSVGCSNFFDLAREIVHVYRFILIECVLWSGGLRRQLPRDRARHV